MRIPLYHAQIQGMSGIVGPSQGLMVFYDYQSKEKYPLEECPRIVPVGAVALPMVSTILEQMEAATLVHLR
jgi:hypothetical protein